MKNLTIVLLALSLSGCAVYDKAVSLWPRDHDSGLVSGYVNLEVLVDKANCSDKQSFVDPIASADWLNRYVVLRNDPQKEAVNNILTNLQKASAGSEAVCNRFLSLSKINLKIVKESWGKR